MTEWLKPVANIGAIMPAPGHIGATDHLSFLEVGVPGFQAVQDYVGLRRAHASHQHGHRRANRAECAEAGGHRDGGGPVPGGDARGHVPEARAAESHQQAVKATTKNTKAITKLHEAPLSMTITIRVFVVWLRVLRGCLLSVARRAGLAADSRAESQRHLHRPRDRPVVSAHRSAAALDSRRRRRLLRAGRRRRSADPVSSRQQSRNRRGDGRADRQDGVDVRLRDFLSRRFRLRRRTARGPGDCGRPRVHARRRRLAARDRLRDRQDAVERRYPQACSTRPRDTSASPPRPSSTPIACW